MYGSARNKKRMKHAAHTLLVPPFGHVVGSESETSWPLPNDASWALTTHPSESLLVPCAQSPQTLITKRANIVHGVCTTRSHPLWYPKGSCVEEGETHFWEGICVHASNARDVLAHGIRSSGRSHVFFNLLHKVFHAFFVGDSSQHTIAPLTHLPDPAGPFPARESGQRRHCGMKRHTALRDCSHPPVCTLLQLKHLSPASRPSSLCRAKAPRRPPQSWGEMRLLKFFIFFAVAEHSNMMGKRSWGL